MLCRSVALGAGLILVAALNAAGQGHPTGTLRGQVVDTDALPLPGVLISAASPSLQGKQTTVTSANGDFIIPFLPPGDYSVTFDLKGFQRQIETVTVTMAETRQMKVKLTIARLSDEVTVAGANSAQIPKTLTVAQTYKATQLDGLPVGRALTDAVLLAPGVNANGPANRPVISGALSYENLYRINGVTINGAIVGAPLPLYIEEAIQETSIATGSISAEYGRFQGGLVNMVTKSGGNAFGGTLRTSFSNDAWRALTPDPEDRTINELATTFELTAGGPVRKDTAWFFGAASFADPERNMTLAYTKVNYIKKTVDRRGELKLTLVPGAGHTVRASYLTRRFNTRNNSFGTVMDLASLYDDVIDFGLSALNYTGVLGHRVFLEAHYSSKSEVTTGRGSRFSDRVYGTPIVDGSRRPAQFNSPTACNVCGAGWLERNDNWNWFGKVSYFLSTHRAGSHSLTVGVDVYEETRQNNNWASGSSYVVEATGVVIDGAVVYPIFIPDRTFINFQPLVAESVGSEVRTHSLFVNDAWRYKTLSINLGYRYDRNRSTDQTGVLVVTDDAFSPRFGVSWDITGNGTWAANLGFARYVTAVSTLVVDAASPGGRTANYSYSYRGDPINVSPPYKTADEALESLFDWYDQNGGPDQPTRNPPVIPGMTRTFGSDTKAPNSREYSIGLARDISHRGVWRLDYLVRNYHDLYGDFVNLATGKVVDLNGNTYDRSIVRNNPDAKRTYNGLTASINYQVPSTQLGANYTLSWSRSNVYGEGPSTAFYRAMIGTYPEYREARWNSPMGYTANDQRQKVRAWVTHSLQAPVRLGRFTIGVLQRFDSALPYDAIGQVRSRNYVTNPGYETPPDTFDYYFSPRFGLRWSSIWSTDLSVNWSKKLARARTEVFFRGVVTNVFNNAGVVAGNSSVLTSVSSRDLKPFNPFAETPVRGVHWAHGPNFGQPIRPESYQAPRTFGCSTGVRF